MATPLKIWMVKKDVEAKELAISIGISTRTVQTYMAGEGNPRYNTAYDIADYLGVHVDKLFPGLFEYGRRLKKMSRSS